MQILVGEPFFLLALERGVITRPRRQLAAIDLDDAGRQPLEERAIVRHEHHRALVFGEEGLEPGNGLDIEVVGGLVQQQQFRLAHQRARQQHAALPSTRQRVDVDVRLQLQPRHHHVGLVRALPLVMRVERAEAFAHHFGDGSIRRQRHILNEPRHARAWLPPHRAAIGRQLAGDDLNQRRLAAAIAADDRNAFTGINLEPHIVKKRNVAVGVRDVLECNERHAECQNNE